MTFESAERYDGLKKTSETGVLILTRCPVCKRQFDPAEEQSRHFRQEHTPADFGLSPLKDQSQDQQETDT